MLDLDNTDIPLYGNQEGRHYHGHYENCCYLPLYVFCGRHLLLARHKRSNVEGASGSVEEVARMVAHIRRAWPRVRITVRGDSGFAREPLMGWCEDNGVDYVFGLAGNKRLERELAGELAQAKALCEASGQAARVFRDFRYQTLDSWSRPRRVVGNAEHTLEGANPRYVVTTLSTSAWDARALYEDLYCARGEAENRIGEQFELFADRASCETMAGNELRMQFSAMAGACPREGGGPHRHPAPCRTAPHTVRRRLGPDHPPQAPQARRPGENQRPPHPLRHRLGLSEPDGVRDGPYLSEPGLRLRLS